METSRPNILGRGHSSAKALGPRKTWGRLESVPGQELTRSQAVWGLQAMAGVGLPQMGRC